MSELQRVLTKLVHYYNDSPSGNIAKLFSPWASRIDNYLDTWTGIEASHFLDTAAGISLDYVASKLRMGRIEAENDENFRARIKLEIMILISSGLVEEIRSIISAKMNIPLGDILIYQNAAPSEGISYLPYYVEISILSKHLPQEGYEKGFKFSTNDAVSTYGSVRGFDGGVLQWMVTPAEMLTALEELIERILSTGVQYAIAVHGGFKFSDDAVTSTYDSSRGFDAGAFRGRFVES